MAKLGGFLLALIVGAGSPAQAPGPTSIERAYRAGNHSVRVRIEIDAFDPRRHTIRLFRPEGQVGAPCAEIDGNRKPLGVDCDPPTTEIRRLIVTIDGIRLPVSTDLYRDCFNPHPGNSLAVRLADDGESVFVFFAGSDAAASYQVIWVLRADGRHARLSCPPSARSNSGFINFEFLAPPEP